MRFVTYKAKSYTIRTGAEPTSQQYRAVRTLGATEIAIRDIRRDIIAAAEKGERADVNRLGRSLQRLEGKQKELKQLLAGILL